MRRRSLITALPAVPALWLGPGAARAQAPAPGIARPRRALVIGNARYAQLPLDNPENDARLVARTLRGLGFQVTDYLNLGVRDFRRALREFGRAVRPDDEAALFYFAGHGVQINGRNYLLPVDVNLRDPDEVRDDAIDLEEVLAHSEADLTQARLFIIDACRDNPFGALPNRPERARKGLAVTGAGGTLIAFAAGPGSTSEDGPAGGNSVYTRRLAAAMREPGLPVETMLKRVAAQVREDTQGRQVPWVNTSMQVDFAFNPTGSAAAVGPALAQAPALGAPAPAVPPRLRVQVVADALLNTDRQQRPATLAMRLYLLRDAGAFGRAAFDALYDSDEATLGADLLVREVVHLRPGSTRTIELPLPPQAHALAVFAAFRELELSQWRAAAALPGPASGAMTVTAQARAVRLDWA